jgi:DnaJ-class molecular chaperone
VSEHPDFQDYIDEAEDQLRGDCCHLCKGTGEINALTDQDYIFVADYADCPLCDGTGEAQ